MTSPGPADSRLQAPAPSGDRTDVRPADSRLQAPAPSGDRTDVRPADSRLQAPAPSGDRTALGILLRHGDHESAHYALVLATGAAAIGRDVTLFATNAGCRALLAATPLAQDPREALLAGRGVATLATLLEAAADLGIRRIACEAGLRAEALDPAALAPGVEVAGVVTFLGAVGAGHLIAL